MERVLWVFLGSSVSFGPSAIRSPGELAPAPFCLTPVSKIAVATALHDGLRARQFYVGTKTLRHPKIRAADQEEAEIWLAQLLIKLRVAAAGNIDIVSVMRLLAYAIVDGIATGELREG
jgi:hypothetical protein